MMPSPAQQQLSAALMGKVFVVRRILSVEHRQQSNLLSLLRELPRHLVGDYSVDAQPGEEIRPLRLHLPQLSYQGGRNILELVRNEAACRRPRREDEDPESVDSAPSVWRAGAKTNLRAPNTKPAWSHAPEPGPPPDDGLRHRGRPSISASCRMVGAWKTFASDSRFSNCCSMRSKSLATRSECPPRSKKFSVMPKSALAEDL